MTQDKAIAAFLAGDPILSVEYRHGKAEMITWRDKDTKRTMTAPTVRHTVENVSGSIAVNERVDEQFNVATFKQPFAKGTKCILRLTGMQVQRGAITASGTLEALEPSSK